MRMPYKSLKNNFKVNFDSTVFLSESSLPEVTIEDEGKMLIVEDGKWVIKTFDNKIEVDSTLTRPGIAADADAAGRRLRELELAVSNLPKPTKEDANKCLRVNALGEWEILPIEEAIQADWNQTDDTKIDFIKNKPILGLLASKDKVSENELDSNLQSSINAAIQTVTTGVGLKTSREEEKVVIDFDEYVTFVFDCGTADSVLAVLGETILG